MSVIMVRAAVKAESAAEVEVGAQEMIAAIEKAQPQGVRYASGLLPDGVTFLVILEIADGTENPLAAMPEYQEFQEKLKKWVDRKSVV